MSYFVSKVGRARGLPKPASQDFGELQVAGIGVDAGHDTDLIIPPPPKPTIPPPNPSVISGSRRAGPHTQLPKRLLTRQQA
jgi:hypothetical protein